MIKTACISDIHGNIEALDAVMENICALGISKILILGDLAFMGPEPNETITKIRKLSEEYDVDIIQGNTDLFIASDEIPNIPDFAQNALKYAKENISKGNIEFLKNLPETKSVKIGETSILMTHGSPRFNNENIFPGRSIEEIKLVIEGTQEALILCGHTHLPAGYQVENQTVVNVGSVGRPFTENQKACYVVIEIDENKKNSFSIEHKFISFDVEKSAKKLSAQNFVGAKYLADLLLKSSAK